MVIEKLFPEPEEEEESDQADRIHEAMVSVPACLSFPHTPLLSLLSIITCLCCCSLALSDLAPYVFLCQFIYQSFV